MDPKPSNLTIAISLILISTIVLFNLESLSLISSPSTCDQCQQYLSLFSSWKHEYNKRYSSQLQQKYRYQIFIQNYFIVKQHNIKYQNKQSTFQLQLNQFADMTNKEFQNAYHNSQNYYIKENNLIKQNNVNAFQCNGPQAPIKDILEVNYTLPAQMYVKQFSIQGTCQSGYAIATISAVQGAMYKSIKKIIPMSAQQIIDCSTSYNNQGCDGGNPLNSLQYLMSHGCMSLKQYPYTGNKQSCKYSTSKKIWDVDNCTKLISNNIKILKSSIYQQPVIVSFDTSDSKFQLYKSGVFIPSLLKCGDKINHYMLAVGWGEITNGTFSKKKTYEYIMAKNSYGNTWGNQGYVNVLINSTINTGACGILKESYFPYL